MCLKEFDTRVFNLKVTQLSTVEWIINDLIAKHWFVI